MPYCEQTTLNHSLSKKYPAQLEPINDLFTSEGFRQRRLFDSEKAINLDKIEREQARGKHSPKPTMDFAVGISNEGKNAQIVLTELKLRVDNPHNITRKEIEDKIKHSTELLSHEPQICQKKYLLFRQELLAVAKSRVARLYGNPPKPSVIVASPEQFREIL